MRYIEKQRRIEQKVLNSIEIIAEEMQVDVDYYPEVYWVGRKLLFEYTNLDEKHEEDFNIVKKYKTGAYLPEERVILIGLYDKFHMAEEAGHFLHFEASGINYKTNDKHSFEKAIISEMFGYFTSKIYDPSRIVPTLLTSYPDFFTLKKKEKNKIKELIEEENPGLDFNEFLIYQQAYNLGERLFYEYLTEEIISKETIRKMFKDPFPEINDGEKIISTLKDILNFDTNRIEKNWVFDNSLQQNPNIKYDRILELGY